MATTEPHPAAPGPAPRIDLQQTQAAQAVRPTTDDGRPPAGQVEVPERPQLAPNVELSGKMEETGFDQQQWLVLRNGAFVQLTELLYRVVQQLDGQRDLEEIAERVSEAIGKRATADNIRQLIAKKLIPMGLVVKADGTVAEMAGGEGTMRSPLAVNMRMKMIAPEKIDAITRLLQVLYAPPVLIAVLLAGAAMQVWLYLVHGVGSSVHDVLYAPGLMLLVLAVIVVSAVFHEFGHAAGLRYGGGKVRGMGVGIYLVYPAFYTDVTDNYRLGRWARVRTDLGGFYFNLIFALAVMGLYVATGQEFLLLIIALINLEIIHQLLPFVRLDGYWTLADLTGIPDFFAHIGPFLRSVLPLPFWKGRKLPPMKGWVKAIYAIYILTVIPLLGFLLFIALKGFPRLLGTAWDSFQQQATGFGAAQGSGDVLGMLGAVVQMLTLALPVFGLAFMFFNLGKRLFGALWAWSADHPVKRAVASVGTLAVASGVLALWLPQLPLPGAPPGPLYAQADFAPIQRSERGSALDAAAQVPVVGGRVPRGPAGEARPGRAGEETPGPASGFGADGSPTVTVTAGRSTSEPQRSTPTRAQTPGATAVARTQAPQGTAPANRPGGQATAVADEPTPTPGSIRTQVPGPTMESTPLQAPTVTRPATQVPGGQEATVESVRWTPTPRPAASTRTPTVTRTPDTGSISGGR